MSNGVWRGGRGLMPFADDLKERKEHQSRVARARVAISMADMNRALNQSFRERVDSLAIASQPPIWGNKDVREEETGMGIMAKYLRGGYSEKG